jgi:hypothetical protein
MAHAVLQTSAMQSFAAAVRSPAPAGRAAALPDACAAVEESDAGFMQK